MEKNGDGDNQVMSRSMNIASSDLWPCVQVKDFIDMAKPPCLFDAVDQNNSYIGSILKR